MLVLLAAAMPYRLSTTVPFIHSTTSTFASFSFTGSDNVAVTGYECSLDAAAFSTCSSPKAYSGLSVGAHAFSVRAEDAAGNVDGTPASRTWTVTASGTVYTVPSSVPSGCVTDATSQILSWIASVPDNSTVSFGPGACYRIEGTLEFKGRALTIEGNGATFRSFNAPEDQRAMWRLWDSDVTLRDMTIVGSYASGGVFNANVEHAHGIDLRGTHAVIENTSVSDVGGDCVYFGLGSARSSGLVRESSCQGTGRNAISVTAGEDIAVEHVTTDQIGYVVFDVEPNTGTGFGPSHVVFNSNPIGTYRLYAWEILGDAPISDQSFTNNHVSGEGLRISAPYPSYAVFHAEPNTGTGFGASHVVFSSNLIGTYRLYAWAIIGNAPISDQSFINNRVSGEGLRISALSPTYRPQGLIVTGNTSDTKQGPPAMDFTGVDTLVVIDNTVPMTGGAMAAVDESCEIDVAENTFTGGSSEVTATNPVC